MISILFLKCSKRKTFEKIVLKTPETINFVSNRKPGKIVACFKIKTNFSFLNENP